MEAPFAYKRVFMTLLIFFLIFGRGGGGGGGGAGSMCKYNVYPFFFKNFLILYFV